MEGNKNFSTDVSQAVECLKKGGVILYPTDTIWGLGCDATNCEAVKKIFQIKKRADSKSMLMLVNDDTALQKIVEVPEVGWELLGAADSPLTIIYDGAHGICNLLIAEDGSAGIRITKERFSNELCKRFGRPIVSTSANLSGEKPPSNFKDIKKEIINAADYVVNYNRDSDIVSNPSHIIKLKSNGEIKIIR